MLLALPVKGFAVSGFSLESGFSHPAIRWLENLPADVDRRLRILALRDRSVTLSSQLNTQLHNEGLHPFIESRYRARDLGLAHGSGEPAQTIEFWFGGKRIHGFGIKAVALPSQNQELVLSGNFPALDESASQLALQRLGDWPSEVTSLAIARDSLQPGSGSEAPDDGDYGDDGESAGNDTHLTPTVSEAVYFAVGNNLIPAWKFLLTINGLPWEAISDDREILGFTPRFFDMTQTSANVYATTKDAATLADIYFSIGDGKSTLENSHFKTDQGYSGQSEATITNGKFDFAGDASKTAQFREANVFAHASQHLDYLLAQGYKWTSAQPITLRVAECYESTCNCTAGRACTDKSNAIYVPNDDDYSTPSIRIAEGDGVYLKDLHYDGAVVSHEFGHHVVFSAITSYSKGSEALQLHEGLADFFVMTRTGNPCLGSGICPAGNQSICYTSQCLRTADNDLTYGSPAFLAGADHQKGQLISGLLWDLKLAGIDTGDLTKIVLGAIDLLPPAATFGDFTSAIQVADRTLFKSAHLATIEQKILARNLDASLSSGNDNPPSETKRRSSGNIFGCTVMAQPGVFPPQGNPTDGPMQVGIYLHDPAGIPERSNKAAGFDVLLALFMAIPLIIGLRRIRRSC